MSGPEHHHHHHRHHGVTKSPLRVVLEMLMCVIGIYVCFAVWSLKQERVVTMPYDLGDGKMKMFKNPFVINLTQNFCAAFVGLAFVLLTSGNEIDKMQSGQTDVETSTDNKKKQQHTFPFKEIVLVGFCATFASPFGYAAMRQLSYPIVLTVKMCKMIPVILIGSLLYRAKYSLEKYMTVVLITVGVLAFSFMEEENEKADSGRKSSSLVGLGLVVINLVMDGFMCSCQDNLVKKKKWNGSSIMLATNISAFLWGVVALTSFEFLPHNGITRPELSSAIEFFVAQPESLMDVLLMGILNASGQVFIFQTIALFGSLTVTAMTLVRKVGSVLLSIYVHKHNVTGSQWAALLTVFVGIVLETRINIKEKSTKHPKDSDIEKPSEPLKNKDE